ncbi:DNA cytosine methyltransferase [Actinoplanes siamensis]|uniref:DNA cytosine methyltransferase n=1 Tax=Actinoplanes siamensis TaxID=1223317 RepID=UPI001EF283B4|nr:DNA cytosine methyltransferase [Actinoplanes siamensis]
MRRRLRRNRRHQVRASRPAILDHSLVAITPRGSSRIRREIAGARPGSIAHCETDRHAQAVLAQRWPEVVDLGDIRDVDCSTVAPVDVLTAGFPCQDISNAGKRAGMIGRTPASGAPSPTPFARYNRSSRSSRCPGGSVFISPLTCDFA